MIQEYEADCIAVVQKCFLSGSNLKFLDWEKLINYIRGNKDPVSLQENILSASVLHPCNLHHPIKKDFQRIFLKKIISELENCGQEVSENLYKEYLSKLNNSSEPEEYHYRHFTVVHDKTITIREKISFVSGGTTGLATWEGGLALAQWCLHNSLLLRSKRVLELGCGLGLTGLSVSLVCRPLSYTFTDHHPSVLQAVEYNIQLNKQLLSETSVKTELLDWEYIANYLDTEIDVVLAADVVFDERLFPSLVNTLYHFLKNKTTFAVLACTERNPQTLSTFLTNLGKFQ
ncbi:protein-lysine N-methyltransferase EEF2KMT [Macrosteles quadrilineatus]|uniref:protein-lysine N-methyltransferase EEF2KMT n=1 Tax=Macrosteles quadrilineatus TaxID=74068 RepID=UPI0023E13FBF|nr:protein-lysine N-methyltransferase EEF2KMT [Macrosteles quadrilineatus]